MPASSAPSRRTMVQGLLVVAAAGVAGYLVAAANDPREDATAGGGGGGGPGGQPAGRRLAGADDVPAGGGLILADEDVVLTRDTAGTVRGFSATCTHAGCTVDRVTGGVISCPCHGSRYDAATGERVAGPAPRPLPPVAVAVRGADVVAT
jgi:Rieske Fe-S protein